MIDPPHRLVLSWGWESTDEFPGATRELPPGSTTVEVSFTPDGDFTVIHLRHSGLPSDGAGEFTTSGWTMYLDRLQTTTAGREPGPDPVRAFLAMARTEGTT